MKRIFTLLLLLVLAAPAISSACTCDPWSTSFRSSLFRQRIDGAAAPNHYIFKAVTLDYDYSTKTAHYQILQQYLGAISFASDIITFKSDGGASCLNNMGIEIPVGDTAIISVFQKQTSTGNPAIDSGNFVNYYCEVNFMRIVNDAVVGWPAAGNSFPAGQLQDSITNFYNSFLSVNTPRPEEQIRISPNPAQDHIRVQAPAGTLSTATIFDLNGRRLAAHQAGSTEILIDTRSLDPGMYLLLLTDKQGNSYRRKWSKQ